MLRPRASGGAADKPCSTASTAFHANLLILSIISSSRLYRDLLESGWRGKIKDSTHHWRVAQMLRQERHFGIDRHSGG